MSITITIPQELESLVLKRATETGKPVETYALDLLKRDAELPDPWELFAPVEFLQVMESEPAKKTRGALEE